MKGYDSKFLEELKSKNDLVEVCSKYVRLEQRGGNYWGRCPMHHEKTASFCINTTEQFYHCFGCHKGGDVISFIMELESLEFSDAVKFLAERAKMPLPSVEYDDDKVKEQKQKKERVYALLKDTAYFYVHNLRNGATKHLEYIEKRGISNENVLKFGIGASTDFNSLPKYLKDKGYTFEEMLLSGAVDVKDNKYYDSLGGRLIIPIINQFNQVIAFGGRLLEKADFAKYKNTKETIVFSKSNVLYNINNLKKIKNEKGLDNIIIVEGYMDTISLVQGGFDNVVASMGTSLTKDQARILKRFSNKVFISYDGDSAGQKASIRGLEILKDEGLDVKVVDLPDEMDPDDVIKKLGHDGYQSCLDKAKMFMDFKLDVLKKTFDLNTAEGRRKYAPQAVKIIKESNSPTEQEDLLKLVSLDTGFTYDSLKREMDNLGKAPLPPPIVTGEILDAAEDKDAKAERFIVYSCLFNKSYASLDDLKEILFISPLSREIADFILKRKKEGKETHPADLYEELDDDKKDGLSMLMRKEVEENEALDKEKYYADCVKTLRVAKLTKEIESLSAMSKVEVNKEKRRALIKEISLKINERSRL